MNALQKVAALEAVAKAARELLDTAIVYDDKCERCLNHTGGHNEDCVVVLLQQKLYCVESRKP